DLRAQGHKIHSTCDAETIIHLYEQHGPGFLERLEGMFALALWDVRQRTLWLARDPLGIKPLYYSLLDDGLIFGSEIRSLVASGLIDLRLNPRAVTSFLFTGSVAGPETVLENVFSVPPGTCITTSLGR